MFMHTETLSAKQALHNVKGMYTFYTRSKQLRSLARIDKTNFCSYDIFIKIF